MRQPDDAVYLQHILDAIAKIEGYLQGIAESAFKTEPLIQDGVIRQLEIIGEAAKRLSRSVTSVYPEIPGQDIAGMRNKLIHDYFGGDIDKVWLTAIDDLPVLKAEATGILAKLRYQ